MNNKTLRILGFVAVMGLTLLLIESAMATSLFPYSFLPENEANTSKSAAEQIALDYVTSKQILQIDEEPLSSETIELGHLILYSHYIRLPDSKGVANEVWFISILDYRSGKPHQDSIAAVVVVDDDTNEIVFHSTDYLEIADYLVPSLFDESMGWSYFNAERVDNLCYPLNYFGRAMIPGKFDISEEEAVYIAKNMIATVEGVQIDGEPRYKINTLLTHCQGICAENLWSISIYDQQASYPKVAAYICEIYATHGKVWYLGKQTEDRVREFALQCEFIYVDNQYCMNPIDTTMIPEFMYSYNRFDEILQFESGQ